MLYYGSNSAALVTEDVRSFDIDSVCFPSIALITDFCSPQVFYTRFANSLYKLVILDIIVYKSGLSRTKKDSLITF